MFMSVCCVVVLLAVTLFIHSELVAGAVTALWAEENVDAGEESATVVDTDDEVVG